MCTSRTKRGDQTATTTTIMIMIINLDDVDKQIEYRIINKVLRFFLSIFN